MKKDSKHRWMVALSISTSLMLIAESVHSQVAPWADAMHL